MIFLTFGVIMIKSVHILWPLLQEWQRLVHLFLHPFFLRSDQPYINTYIPSDNKCELENIIVCVRACVRRTFGWLWRSKEKWDVKRKITSLLRHDQTFDKNAILYYESNKHHHTFSSLSRLFARQTGDKITLLK